MSPGRAYENALKKDLPADGPDVIEKHTARSGRTTTASGRCATPWRKGRSRQQRLPCEFDTNCSNARLGAMFQNFYLVPTFLGNIGDHWAALVSGVLAFFCGSLVRSQTQNGSSGVLVLFSAICLLSHL